MSKIYDKLCVVCGHENVLMQESMQKHTTFRTGGPAEILVMPSAEELPQVLELCSQEQVPYLVIGNGSNLLVGDGGIDGIVIEIGKRMADVQISGDEISAEAGAMIISVAMQAAENSLTGLEFASGIPGSVGGAVAMNAGAYGGEMKDVLTEATVLTKSGEIRTLTVEELNLSYRHSVIQEEDFLVLRARMKLAAGDPEAIYERINELKEKRVSKQPLEYPSAGSTFKRPEGYFAGKLIEDAGLRGFRVGGAQVSEKHCGFVINREQATTEDVLSLMEQVQKKVKDMFGVWLEPEVKFVGKR